MAWTLELEPRLMSSILAVLGFWGLIGRVAAWKWLLTPSSVTISIYTSALHPKHLPRLVRGLLPELQELGFQPLGLRVETTASQMPYFSVKGDRPMHVEFEAADGRCFLTLSGGRWRR